MQRIEDDLDELFQRAAENYPLKNEKGDWESVAKKIAVADVAKDVIVLSKTKKNKKGIAIILFLFVLLAGLLTFYIFMPKVSNRNLVTKTPKEDVTTTFYKPSGNHNVVIPGNNNVPDPNSSEKNIQNKTGNQQFSGTGPTRFKAATTDASISSATTAQNGKEFKSPDKNLNAETANNFPTDEDARGKVNKDKVPNLNDDAQDIFSQAAKQNIATELKKKNDTAVTGKNKDKASAVIPKKKGFYVGVITALDFSKVESSSFDNSGFDAGLLLGFRMNQVLSFESGIVWNKKNYLSEGKNFNMNEVRSTMPSGMVINNLESNSTLIEIPIKAKLDFIRKTNFNLFLTGGVSAYIMTKEKNQYNVTVNGTPEKVSGVYKKNNYGLPAVAGFSLGYEYNFYKSLNIRIEPFLKIPIQGMGVGKLPVTSAGLQIGITGRLK